MGRRLRCAPLAVALVFAALVPAAMATATAASSKATKPKAKRRVPTTTRTTGVASSPAVTSQAAPHPSSLPPATGSLNVFAAASLTAAFTDIAAAFEVANPGAKVTLNFGGSSTLVTQIINGAPADVFASADTANMDKLANAKLIRGTPLIFTRNRLMIVVPRGNRMRVKTLADLANPEVFVALGAVGVPAGDYARQILARAGVTVTPKSLEPSVSAIVSKVSLKEIDAGIVYVTDVAIDEYRVDGIAIPDEQNLIAAYPIAGVAPGRNPATAAAFVAYMQGSAAQSILKKYKFLPLP